MWLRADAFVTLLDRFTFESNGCTVAPANSRWEPTIHRGIAVIREVV